MNSDELLHAARRTIEAAELTAIEHLQLGTFLIHTCSREDTLRFILKAAKEPGKSVGENLKFVKQAFREIAKRCNMNCAV